MFATTVMKGDPSVTVGLALADPLVSRFPDIFGSDIDQPSGVEGQLAFEKRGKKHSQFSSSLCSSLSFSYS